MSGDEDLPSSEPHRPFTFGWARDRIIRFGLHVFRIEQTIEDLSQNQARQQKMLNAHGEKFAEIEQRIANIEGQLDVIKRLLESQNRT